MDTLGFLVNTHNRGHVDGMLVSVYVSGGGGEMGEVITQEEEVRRGPLQQCGYRRN